MTKERLRMLIGENIRNERLSRGISVDELAEMIGLTSGFVGLIERGQRGTTPITLFKLADVLGVPVDAFFYNCNSNVSLNFSEGGDSDGSQKKRKIESLMVDFTDDELDFIVSTIKNMRIMNRSKSASTYIDEEV